MIFDIGEAGMCGMFFVSKLLRCWCKKMGCVSVCESE